jgi:hypothetical protein
LAKTWARFTVGGWRWLDMVFSSIFALVHFLVVKALPSLGMRSFCIHTTRALEGPGRVP